VYPTPDAALQQAVTAVRAVAKTDAVTANRLAAAFFEFAQVLKASPDIVKTTTAFRTAVRRFGAALASRHLKINGLAAALEAAENAYLGASAKPLAPGAAAALLHAFAWALQTTEAHS